jgi:uncharacterized membrane protein
MKAQTKKMISHGIQTVRSLFFSGLFAILPLALTSALVAFTLKFARTLFAPIYNIEPEIFHVIPYSEILVVAIVIVGIGAILRFFLLEQVIHAIEYIVNKIPLIREIYFSFKHLTHAFNSQDKLSFQKVILVEFPRNGMYSLGFITNEQPSVMIEHSDKKYYNVFIPTTPNPTHGYYLIVEEKDIIFSSLTRQAALTLIMSGGIIQPKPGEYKKE